jgi:hypothetical protein
MQERLHIFVDLSPEMSIIPPSIFMAFDRDDLVGSKVWMFSS